MWSIITYLLYDFRHSCVVSSATAYVKQNPQKSSVYKPHSEFCSVLCSSLFCPQLRSTWAPSGITLSDMTNTGRMWFVTTLNLNGEPCLLCCQITSSLLKSCRDQKRKLEDVTSCYLKRVSGGAGWKSNPTTLWCPRCSFPSPHPKREGMLPPAFLPSCLSGGSAWEF